MPLTGTRIQYLLPVHRLQKIDVIHLTEGSQKMKVLKVRLNLKPKSRPLATTLAVGPAVLPYGLILQGFGQLYNGQYLKAGGFFLNAVMGANILLESASSNTMTGI